MSDNQPKKTKRPRTEYSPELAARICEQVAVGEMSVSKLCLQSGYPSLATLTRWLGEHEDFARQMAQARELRADRYRDRIEDITVQLMAGKIDPQAGRVTIDGLRWLAAVEKPGRYGDRVRQEHVIRAPDDANESNSQQWLNRVLTATVVEPPRNVVALIPKREEGEGQ